MQAHGTVLVIHTASKSLSTTTTTTVALPCIRAFYLNADSSTAVVDVAQAVKQDQETSGQHIALAAITWAKPSPGRSW